MTPATLSEFAAANDAAMATPGKLKKQAALGDYFRLLGDDEDLRRGVRYAAGRTFAATDERVLNVGGAIVSEAVLALLRLDPREYHDLVVASGEIGEALSKVWPVGGPAASGPTSNEPTAVAAVPPSPAESSLGAQRGAGDGLPSPAAPLTLADLDATFAALAAGGNVERKRALLLDLFARCALPREATYLAKIIFGDLRTGAQEGVLQAAVAHAFGKTPSEIQRCQLLVGDLGEVAVLAQRDALGSAKFAMFHPVQFMLASAKETPEAAAETLAGRAFYAEDKLDGIRAQVHKSAGPDGRPRVAIYTRTMDRADRAFPDVAAALAALPGEFLLDGEIVPWRDGCVLPFAHVQKRLGRKTVSAKILRENPAVFIAFDLLYQDGELLMDAPLHARRQALRDLALGAAGRGPVEATEACGVDAIAVRAPGSPAPDVAADRPTLLLSQSADVSAPAEIAAAFEAARARRNEGIVLKDPQSPYSPGRRGQVWLKLKTHLPTFDCVVTAAETGHGKRRNWLSDFTFAVWDRDPSAEGAKLVNIGKAYSGLTDEEIARMTELFTELTVQQFGRVRLVKPNVVLEIACDTIQRSARHASGYALRFPRIKRIRWDKTPEAADALSRVAEVYESHVNFGRVAPAQGRAKEPTLFD